MTKEEAIEFGNMWLQINEDCKDSSTYAFFQMAIQALKQEPKRVELEGDGYADGELVYDYGKCPTCGWEFEDGDKDWEEPYCCHCGQKLTWLDSAEAKANKEEYEIVYIGNGAYEKRRKTESEEEG